MNYRLIKLIVPLLLTFRIAYSEDSFYKFRFYQPFLQEVFQKNLKHIFEKSQRFLMQDIQLKELETRLTNVHIKVMPPTANYADLDLELFFNEDLIVLEMHDLVLAGSGMLTDPQTGNLEVIHFQGPLSTGNILLKPEAVIRGHDLFPKFTIDEVNLALDETNTQVSALGQTPLFKSKKFENAMKKWLHEETRSLEEQIKQQLIEVESQIWKQIPFEYQGIGYKLMYSLAEQMKLNEDNLEVGISSELYEVDHGEFKKKLRKIHPTFSEEPDFKQDLQMVFDENLFNHLSLALFYTNKVYSLRELLFQWIPQKYKTYLAVAQAFFQTSTLSYLFPDLVKDFSHGKLLDLRCGFSKRFLKSNLEEDIHPSQIKFHNGNKVAFDLGFGCGFFVFSGNYDEIEDHTKIDDALWKNWRSFFVHMDGSVKLRFPEQRHQRMLKAVIDEGFLNIKQLRVYRSDKEIKDEIDTYSKIIQDQFQRMVGNEDHEAYTMPFLNAPNKIECLGLEGRSPKAEIMEGFMRLSYDFKISTADPQCLFSK